MREHVAMAMRGGRRNVVCIVASWLATPAIAQTPGTTPPGTTPAGTAIVNVAHLAFFSDGAQRQVESNAVTLIVAERLDVGLVRGGDGAVGIAATPVAVPVVLTNMGTGEESFTVVASSSVPAAVVRGIAIDRDGDGRFDPAVDTMLGDATPPLAADETLKLVAMVARATDAPAGAETGGTMTVTARAVTGSGATDISFLGAGDAGGDAVIGPTRAIATVSAPFTDVAPPTPRLVKTQAVRAPDGSATPVSGAVVTYTLTAQFPASATSDARIDDPVPAAAMYLPGTLTLDGQALTEADDGDPGRVADGRVTVALGKVSSNTTREVRFQVRLP